MSGQRSVLITGCSAGSIGDAVAQQFLKRGFRVYATARSLEKVKHLKELGITTIIMDITDMKSIDSAKEIIQKDTGGKLDVLFNNAGQNLLNMFSDTSIEQMRSIYEVNVFSILTVSKAFLPLLIEAKGTILNHGSMCGCLGMIGQSVYGSSKAAVAHLSNTMRLELAPLGVRVVHLVTGMVRSNIFPPDPPTRVPKGSLFEPCRDGIEYQWSGREGEILKNFSSADNYAQDLVADLLGERWTTRNAKWLWEGSMSWMIWMVSTFLWEGAMDSMFRKLFKLNFRAKPY